MVMKRRRYVLVHLLMVLFILGCREGEERVPAGDPGLLLPESALPAYEQHIDHAGLLSGLDEEALERGRLIYGAVCFSCHGDPDQPGSLPDAFRFWSGRFRHGKDPYRIYQSLSRGFGLMPPQVQLTPREKYDVIHFIRETYLRTGNPDQYAEVDAAYLASLPEGDRFGPDPRRRERGREMNYGDFLIDT